MEGEDSRVGDKSPPDTSRECSCIQDGSQKAEEGEWGASEASSLDASCKDTYQLSGNSTARRPVKMGVAS